MAKFFPLDDVPGYSSWPHPMAPLPADDAETPPLTEPGETTVIVFPADLLAAYRRGTKAES